MACAAGAAIGCGTLLMPFVGFAIIAYVLVNMAKPAKIAGVGWLVIGVGILLLSARRRVVALPEQPTSESR